METYNQKQPATSRTLPCGSRPSSQPPLHTVLQTYRERNWDYTPSHSFPEQSANAGGVVQAFFYSTAPGMSPECVGLEVVFNLINKDERILGALTRLFVGEVEPLGYLEKALKKVEEGPDMLVSLDRESEMYSRLVSKVMLFLGLVKKEASKRPKEASKRPKEAVLLKINRLAGFLEKKASMFPVLKEIPVVLGAFIEKRDPTLIISISSLVICLLDDFKGTIGGGNVRQQWFLFDSLSLLGPLFNALSFLLGEEKEVDKTALWVNWELREIRQLMETNLEGISVVAHRGMGPTNRSMGGLIAQDDPRRLNRPAENSPSAFNAAMSYAAGGGLDGVECDVFLSKDKTPMLSHEEKVEEQLSDEMKAKYSAITAKTKVGDLEEKMLLGLQRTSDVTSCFMTLTQLLEMAGPVAVMHYKTTGKPFRVEVEMKGTHIRDASAQQIAKNSEEMEFYVARAISQFKKRNPDIPMTILLFNGVPAEVKGYAKMRMGKTALGSIYTGFNAKRDENGLQDLESVGLATDELRYMMHEDKDFSFTAEQQKHFITTLVYGVETVPANRVDMGLQPTGIVNKAGKRMAYPNPLDDFFRLIDLFQKRLTMGPNKIHLLTDYAGKASYMKELLSEGVSPGGSKEDIQGVFYVFFAVANNIEVNLRDPSGILLDEEHQGLTPKDKKNSALGFFNETQKALDKLKPFFKDNLDVMGLITGAEERLGELRLILKPPIAPPPAEEPPPVPVQGGGSRGRGGRGRGEKPNPPQNRFVYIASEEEPAPASVPARQTTPAPARGGGSRGRGGRGRGEKPNPPQNRFVYIASEEEPAPASVPAQQTTPAPVQVGVPRGRGGKRGRGGNHGQFHWYKPRGPHAGK